MRNRIIYFLLMLFFGVTTIDLKAQNVSINADGTAPDGSAMLDVSSTTRGALLPRMTMTQRDGIANPATGLLLFQIDNTPGFYINLGTPGTPDWQKLIAGNETPVSIEDADNDTKVQVEESGNEDIIRFDIAGNELMRLDSSTLHLYDGTTNVFVGFNSGISKTTGLENTSLGFEALSLNESGNSNTGIGNIALKKNTGDLNTAVGAGALTDNTSGRNNTAVGRNSLRDMTTGITNTAIGQASGVQMITGDNNVFVGDASGEGKTGGSSNTIIGSSAGFNNGTQDGNIFLGFQAGFNETGSDKLYIENSNSATPLIYGDFAADSLVINGNLTVDPARDGTGYTFPASRTTTAGDVLMSDLSGNLSWTTPAMADGNGIYSGSGSISGRTTVALGADSLAFTSNAVNGFSVDGTTFSINSATDQVGIGTSSPQNTLSVHSSTAGSYLDIKGIGDAFNFSGFILESDEATDKSWAFYHRRVASELNYFALEFFDGTTFTKPFAIEPDGSVLIGTLASDSLLDVAGGAQIDRLSINGAYSFPTVAPTTDGQVITRSGGNLVWATPTSSTDGNGIYSGSGNLTTSINVNQSAHSINFNANGVNAFSVGSIFSVDASNNRIGIGTSSPAFTLDVNGIARVNQLNVGSAYTLPTIGPSTDGQVLTRVSGNLAWAEPNDDDWTVSGGVVSNTTERLGLGTTSFSGNYLAEFEAATGGTISTTLSLDNNYDGANQTFGLITEISNAGTGQKFGLYTTVASNTTAQTNAIYGTYNKMTGGFVESVYGSYNELTNAGTGRKTGVFNSIQAPASSTNQLAGVDNLIFNPGSGDSYGLLTAISGFGTGARYGVFSDVSANLSTTTETFGTRNRMNVDGSGNAYGIYMDYTQAKGSGDFYGTYVDYNGATGAGDHYGFYSDGEDFNYFSGNVGIGTSSPSFLLSLGISHANTKLALWENGVASFGMGVQTGNFIFHTQTSTDAFNFYDDESLSNHLMTIQSSGNVGIGTTTTSSVLDVAGDIETGAADAFYFGDPTTDGTWRIKRDGDDLSFERLESGTWNFKMKINP